ncbi:MAG: hypothetical protein KDK91_25345, partial [Gammaproteobacteria bacterium]|nr:hypothetical protein [Gammaproteobacteria bacterium]
MTDIIIMHESLQRIDAALAERAPDVRAIGWSSDGKLLLDEQPIDANEIRPRAAWISFDVFAAGCLEAYARTLSRYDSLEWVQSAHAGLDHPIYKPLLERGVRLSKSGAQSIPITEYVLAYALAWFQDMGERRQAQREKRWQPHRFRELWHSNWLVVGYGHIGRGVARRAKAFDCHVTVIRRSRSKDEYADVVAPLGDLGEHLPQADVVVLACPDNEETRGLADARFFERMKPGTLLINVARGSLVDEQALLDGLQRQQPAHAVLDVFQT